MQGIAKTKRNTKYQEPTTLRPHHLICCMIVAQHQRLHRLMLVEAIHKIAHHRGSLSRDEARAVMGELLAGKATDAQIAALLVALHMKGETVEEIVGFAEAIRAAAQPLSSAESTALDISGTERDALVDTCGTGGDASDTFNISTASALTIAGAGVRVAQHGNRG